MSTAATIDTLPAGDLFRIALGQLHSATHRDARTSGRRAVAGTGGWKESGQEWFPAFYSETAGRLRGYIGQLVGDAATADDITQEAYLRMLRIEIPTRDPDRLRSYLYRTATNLVRDHWRSRKRRPEHDWLDEPAAPAPETTAGTLGLDMARLLSRLSKQQQSLLWLAYVEGATHREIAAVLDVKEASVRVLLFRARRRMAELIRGCHLAPEETP